MAFKLLPAEAQTCVNGAATLTTHTCVCRGTTCGGAAVLGILGEGHSSLHSVLLHLLDGVLRQRGDIAEADVELVRSWREKVLISDRDRPRQTRSWAQERRMDTAQRAPTLLQEPVGGGRNGVLVLLCYCWPAADSISCSLSGASVGVWVGPLLHPPPISPLHPNAPSALTRLGAHLVQQLHHAFALHAGPALDGRASPDPAVLLLDLWRAPFGDEGAQFAAQTRGHGDTGRIVQVWAGNVS